MLKFKHPGLHDHLGGHLRSEFGSFTISDADENMTNNSFLPLVSKAFGVFVIIYFAMLSRLPLTIDAEVAIMSPPEGWIRQKRWFTYLIAKYVVPSPVLEYWTLAFFGICAAIGLWFIIKSCNFTSQSSYYIGFAAFISFPIWSLILEFPANTPSASISLVLISASVFSIVNKDWSNGFNKSNIYLIIGEILAVSCSIGAYQALLFVFIGIIIYVSYFRERRRPQLLINGAVVTIAALIAHLLISHAFLEASGLQFDYISNFFQISALFNDPVGILWRILTHVAAIYTGLPSIYGATLWASGFLVAAAVIVTILSGDILKIMLLVAAILIPFPLMIISAGTVPLRALIAVSVTIWLCSMLLMEHHDKRIRCLGRLISLVLVIEATAAISQYQSERDFVAKFDQHTATSIYQRIAEVSDLTKVQTVDFFGHLEGPKVYPVAKTSTASASFFSWDGGNPGRIFIYMKLLGFNNLRLSSREERIEIGEQYKKMPLWPARGSVQLYHGIVMVKLSDRPGFYYLP